MIKLSASFNPCPEDKAVDYCKLLQRMNADYLHCDLMRSDFVGHDALSVETIKDIYDNTLMPLDVHVMANEPKSLLKTLIAIKPNIITVHYEAFKNKKDMLNAFRQIHKKHIMVGLSINPSTFVRDIKEYLPYVDVVLIMGVEPGKSGQKMISNTLPKVKELRGIIYNCDYKIKIEVDGGVNEQNLKDIYNAGADIVVMGSCLYDSPNKTKLIEKVHNIQ